MLTLKDLSPAQTAAADYLLDRDHTLLIAETGFGKSVVCLTVLEELLALPDFSRALIIAPLRVVNNVWSKEHKQWNHLQHLRVGIATGKDRDTVLDDLDSYDVVAINFDVVSVLNDKDLFKHFDCLVVDESTKLAAGGKWFKSIRRHIPHFKWRLVMSATPVIEGMQRIFYQMMLVDAGATLGRNKQKFQLEYMRPLDFKGYRWEMLPGAAEQVTELIAPYVYVADAYKDDLPPFSVVRIDTPLPPPAMKSYREMAGKFSTEGVLAETAAAKVQKLQQIASGLIYDKDRKAIQIHTSKYDALADLVSDSVSNFLLVYQFVDQLRELRRRFPELVTLDDAPDVVERWNNGEIKLLCLHALSGGHGLNLQHGGHDIIWLAPIWSLDQFTQTNERLWRRGQTKPVTAHVLVAPDTVDELVLLRHEHKSQFMPAFIDHLNKLKEV